jgi:signal transduction histidine kinase
MIDTLSIQTKPIEVHLKEENLLTLLQETVTRLRRSTHRHTIELKIPPGIQTVLIRADGQQIIEVLTNYLVNALSHSPVDRPVAVQLVLADIVALILVHDEALGLATEEQKALLRRYSESKDHTIHHEVDVNLGTGFYLCRMLIEQYHGHVGVQSDPERGTTFWFTLPIEALTTS